MKLQRERWGKATDYRELPTDWKDRNAKRQRSGDETLTLSEYLNQPSSYLTQLSEKKRMHNSSTTKPHCGLRGVRGSAGNPCQMPTWKSDGLKAVSEEGSDFYYTTTPPSD